MDIKLIATDVDGTLVGQTYGNSKGKHRSNEYGQGKRNY